MLTRSQLEDLAQTFTDGNIGHVETLYLQDIVLHAVYRNVVDELVFKGGTALLKLYNLDRFSEDLDFTATEQMDLKEIVKAAVQHLESFGVKVEKAETGTTKNSFNARIGIKGPLYTGDERSLNFVRIEVNKRTQAEKPIVKRYTPNFPDIPAFEILALREEEILAEKIRALATRTQPRDLYDIYHLLNKGVKTNKKLVEEKLKYYELEFDPEDLLKEAEKNRKNWKGLENLVYSRLPKFEKALELLVESISEKE
ncbi:hypothetical protein C9439_05370 [archaeon SCG-AAA382B04]|nr:hypothetical protein C9439_05370 [archaeon SCG-AAA382B04]